MSDMLNVPGTGMAGADPLLQKILQRADSSSADLAASEAQFRASQEREAKARAAQGAAMAPVIDKERAALAKGAPPPPEEQPMPPTPKPPHMDSTEMGNVLSLVTFLAAAGGLLTRAPLTAALNNFAAGVDGLKKGQDDVYAKQMTEFKANFEKARAANESAWKKYQAARDKYGTDLAGLQNELKLIAAETQNPIDQELSVRGDIVSLVKLHESANASFDKAAEAIARIEESRKQHEQMAQDRAARLAESTRHDKEMERLRADLNKTAGAREHRLEGAELSKVKKEFEGETARLRATYLAAFNKAPPDKKDALTAQYRDNFNALRTRFIARGFTNPPTTPDEGAPKAAAAPSATYASANEVKAAFKAGKITREEARKILLERFPDALKQGG